MEIIRKEISWICSWMNELTELMNTPVGDIFDYHDEDEVEKRNSFILVMLLGVIAFFLTLLFTN